jgi:hypothetical protein
LAQVDYVRVVDLDIGASKSDDLRDQSGLARPCDVQVQIAPADTVKQLAMEAA